TPAAVPIWTKRRSSGRWRSDEPPLAGRPTREARREGLAANLRACGEAASAGRRGGGARVYGALGSTVEVFAANRARGRVALAVEAASGTTRRARVHEQGALRMRFPRPASNALESVLVNTAGGMAGGDRYDVELELRKGAHLMLGTAAAEKVY